MTDTATLTPCTVRVRYAECDAWGELQLSHWHALFDGALAHAMGQLGLDWRQATHPAQALRPAGSRLAVDAAVGYDEELEFAVTGAGMQGGGVAVQLVARRPGGPALARAELAFACRGGVHAPRALPADLVRALARLPALTAAAGAVQTV